MGNLVYAAGVDIGGGRSDQVIAASGAGAATGSSGGPEFADVGRLARRVVRRAVAVAREDEDSVGRLLADHLGGHAAELPVAKGSWPGYDRVNVQTGLEVWLAEPGRTHRLVGLTKYRHTDFGLADLLQRSERWGPGIGNVETEALPAGPGGLTRPCVQCGIYLTADAAGAVALLVRGPEEHGMNEGVTIEVVCAWACGAGGR